jgi:hypothetical protein
MPITLIHLIGKLITKVLANHLAPKLSNLVHCSQSAFIKGVVSRTIFILSLAQLDSFMQGSFPACLSKLI